MDRTAASAEAISALNELIERIEVSREGLIALARRLDLPMLWSTQEFSLGIR
jgi:hypothetical protein